MSDFSYWVLETNIVHYRLLVFVLLMIVWSDHSYMINDFVL
jgi:hypothetical protein